MLRPILLAAVAVAATVAPAGAADFVMAGKPGRLETGFIGCRDKDDLSKVKSLFLAGDKEAAIKFVTRKIPDCRPFSEGVTGIVEENSVWSNSTCLRPKGEPDCFWLPMPFVKPQ
ncbi:hypothetical protein ABC766_12930 [Methylobacterium fujisawaense]|uniref:hypothetical protein n=1 Tax=Methylobacterium fujisawaense TaxID=107400 RepID=UPI0031F51A83